ncbi:hypothetical protein Taro_035085 [Colocasia esculenta]|uniref:Uncharacterized protein n=1 Tax=Colocasia esculenta TaxID=4460 RepID=A0A843W5N1_COLES|nr:hypothetical protein [Colocasia esculenta]
MCIYRGLSLPSLVVQGLFRNTSAVGYPRFCVSQARVFVVLGVWCWLESTVLWLVLVERQLDLSSVTARLRVTRWLWLTHRGVPGRRHSCTEALWWYLVVVGDHEVQEEEQVEDGNASE